MRLPEPGRVEGGRVGCAPGVFAGEGVGAAQTGLYSTRVRPPSAGPAPPTTTTSPLGTRATALKAPPPSGWGTEGLSMRLPSQCKTRGWRSLRVERSPTIHTSLGAEAAMLESMLKLKPP